MNKEQQKLNYFLLLLNKEQQQIIDEVYENYCKSFEVNPNNFNVDELVKGHDDQCWGYPILDHVKPTSKEYKRGQINAYLEGKAEKPFFYLTQEEFINKCKTDNEFSEKWDLKVEERELTRMERWDWLRNKCRGKSQIPWDRMAFPPHEWLNEVKTIDAYDINANLHKGETINVPTKLITITYKENKIESYG